MSRYNLELNGGGSKGNTNKKLNNHVMKAAVDELSNQRKFLMKDENFSSTEKKINFKALKQENDYDECRYSVESKNNIKKTINFTTTP